jgi:hypothetical protein
VHVITFKPIRKVQPSLRRFSQDSETLNGTSNVRRMPATRVEPSRAEPSRAVYVAGVDGCAPVQTVAFTAPPLMELAVTGRILLDIFVTELK